MSEVLDAAGICEKASGLLDERGWCRWEAHDKRRREVQSVFAEAARRLRKESSSGV